MHLLKPVSDLTQAIFMPLKALFVVGVCATINAMTYHGNWWFKWVALGMGIATVVSLARGLKALLLLGLLAWAGRWVYKRYGQQARERFDAWAASAQPQARQVLAVVRGDASAMR